MSTRNWQGTSELQIAMKKFARGFMLDEADIQVVKEHVARSVQDREDVSLEQRTAITLLRYALKKVRTDADLRIWVTKVKAIEIDPLGEEVSE